MDEIDKRSIGNQITTEDYLINLLETQKKTKQEIGQLKMAKEDHDRRITELEREVPINGAFNNYLTKLRRSRIVYILGGKRSKAYKYKYTEGHQYKSLSNKVFAEAGRAFKEKFNISFYAELRQWQYEDAVKFWKDYEPSKIVMQEINQINNQMQLEPKSVWQPLLMEA